MDPLYIDERASRERLWSNLVKLDEENRRKPPERAEQYSIRQPLSIIQVERHRESTDSQLLKLCYLYQSPDHHHRKWLCSFCGKSMTDHSWSSYDSEEDGVVVSRWQPRGCTLRKLLDRTAQDFFPGRKVSLDMEKSHLNDQIRLVFRELDELSTVMSTTWIYLQEKADDTTSFPAMNIDQQFGALKGWLEVCEKRRPSEIDEADETDEVDEPDIIHDQCHRGGDDLVIPAKRILNLADAATGFVRIVETANHKGRYASLSHCWGDPKRHPIMSTHATLRNHMSGLAISSLPKSFRDAIKVCLHLDIQYLWIDCLCIVQDDRNEWLSEAEKMAEIYQQSYLGIAATRAQNSQHGFLFDFPDDTVHYEILAEAPRDEGVTEYRTFRATFWIDHKSSKSDSTPLDRRAWCLQEWYLPKRVVEFCLGDIRLICLRSVETRFGRTTDENTKTRLIVRDFRISKEHYFRTLWEHIRKDLFDRSLTKPSDMLPAVAGLAQMLEKMLIGVSNHRYLAGLWSTRISEDLSWTVLGFDAATESIEGIPTWSWASTTAAGAYIYGRPSQTFVDLIEARCIGYARPKEVPASLKVKGFIVSLFLRVDHQRKGYEGRPSLSFWANENSAMAARTEEVEAGEKACQKNNMFISDMPICPASHHHESIREGDKSGPRRVSSVIRASKKPLGCDICTKNGYVTPVQLLLLTRTDLSMTVLVLAPISSQSSKGIEGCIKGANEVYHRLGLIEIDCIRQDPWMATADGLVVPADVFWDIHNPSARTTITIV